jgi:hypothetical protein
MILLAIHYPLELLLGLWLVVKGIREESKPRQETPEVATQALQRKM